MKLLLIDDGYVPFRIDWNSFADQQLRQMLPDAVLLNIHVGHRPNWNVLERVRVHAKTAQLPMIACSEDPFVLHEYAEMLEKFGCIVVNEYDLDVILATLKEVIDAAEYVGIQH